MPTPTMNYSPGVESSGATRKKVAVSEGTRRKRWLVGRGPALRHYDLKFPGRPTAEMEEQLALWEARWPDLPVLWTDPFLQQERQFIFNSNFKRSRVTRGIYDYEFSLREVKVYAPGSVAPAASVFPYVPDYGFELEESKEVLSSDAWDESRAARALEGTQKARVEVGLYGRAAADFLGIEASWIYHFPGRPITFEHAAATGLTGSWMIESELSWQYGAHNLRDCKFIVRRV